MHAIPNLVRLCPPCHRWATEAPQSAVDTGWVLRGTVTPDIAAVRPVALLGRVWAFLHPGGWYVIAGHTIEHLGQIDELLQVDRGATALVESPTDGPAVATSVPGDGALGQPRNLVVPTFQMDVPALFRVERGQTMLDFLTSLVEQSDPVDGIREIVETLDQLAE